MISEPGSTRSVRSKSLAPTGPEVRFDDPANESTLRHLGFTYSEGGTTTAFYVRDDTNEGDGSIVGSAFGQVEGWLFGDGFETGDTSRWSTTVE